MSERTNPARTGAHWTLSACLAAAALTAACGLAAAILLPQRPPDDAFRSRLEDYRRIGESIGRGPQRRLEPTAGVPGPNR